MKKSDLRNGDIVVQRSGTLAVVIEGRETYLLYPYAEGGYDFLDDFNEDMTYRFPEGKDDPSDIMQVYRSEYGAAVGFNDFEDEEPIYERDETWSRFTEEELAAMAEEDRKWEEEQVKLEAERSALAKARGYIYIVAQYYYGNRTGTEIRRVNVDHFLAGNMNPEEFPDDAKNVKRELVRVPGAEHIVIVYDKNKEDRYVNVEFPKIYAEEAEGYRERWGEELKIRVSCEIPEIGFKLHTRCFACRIDENGELQSLQDGDEEKFIKYFAK